MMEHEKWECFIGLTSLIVELTANFFFFHVYLFTMLPSVSFQKLKFEFAEFEFIEDVKRLFTSLQLAININ